MNQLLVNNNSNFILSIFNVITVGGLNSVIVFPCCGALLNEWFNCSVSLTKKSNSKVAVMIPFLTLSKEPRVRLIN